MTVRGGPAHCFHTPQKTPSALGRRSNATRETFQLPRCAPPITVYAGGREGWQKPRGKLRGGRLGSWVWLGAAKPRLARTPGRFPQLSAPTTRSFCPMLHGPLPTRVAPAHVNTSLAAPEAFLLYQHNRENDPTSRSQHPVPGVHLRHSLRMITPRGPRAAWSGAFRPLEAASVGYRAPHYMDNGMFEQEAPPQQATATLSRSTFRRSIGLITPPGPRAA